jgi:hypothetical protein
MGAAFAGVMIRESQATNSRFAMLGLYPQYGLQSSRRGSPTGSVQITTHDIYSKNVPRWLRIVRKGNQFITFTSSDGVNWQDTLNQATIAMDSTVLIGLAVSSGSTTETIDSRFSSVACSVSPPTSVRSTALGLPKEFNLHQNYPNPFNPTTTIRYAIPRTSRVTIEIFNIMGQRVATLAFKQQEQGEYQVLWNGRNSEGTQVASGLYFCRMQARSNVQGNTDNRTFMKKLLLIR